MASFPLYIILPALEGVYYICYEQLILGRAAAFFTVNQSSVF